ncbi:MAG: SDR family oxidoreductase [Candidatus Omnitrophica bacterium]|nr:SDR family oxidoreductase [Candidatus Omnitrophota bacterium]
MSKTVIITGGTKGIGAAISQVFYEAGYHVLIGARNNNGLASRLGERARFLKIDVTKEPDHIRLAKTALRWTKRLDVYINNAGFSQWKPIHEFDAVFWDKMMDTNLKGTMWGCKTAAEYLSTGGVIINISSLAGKRGSANNSAYCASKFGVTGLTQALAKELGQQGVRVNAICPVYVETEGLLRALRDKRSPAKGKSIKIYFQRFKESQSALQRLPKGEEVAQTCLFFASDASSAITGQSLNVDCGVLPS